MSFLEIQAILCFISSISIQRFSREEMTEKQSFEFIILTGNKGFLTNFSHQWKHRMSIPTQLTEGAVRRLNVLRSNCRPQSLQNPILELGTLTSIYLGHKVDFETTRREATATRKATQVFTTVLHEKKILLILGLGSIQG